MTPRKDGPHLKTGRKTLCTPEATQQAAAAIRAGGSLNDAAVAAGVSLGAVLEWVRRGEGVDARTVEPEYVAFAAEMRKAKTAARLEMLQVVRKAALAGTWQAASWFLERKYPEEFALINRLRDETSPDQRRAAPDIDHEQVVAKLAELDELGKRRRVNGQAATG